MKIFLVVAPSLSYFLKEMDKKIMPNDKWKKKRQGEYLINGDRYVYISHPDKMLGFRNAETIFMGDLNLIENLDEFYIGAIMANRP
jgi:hypothetical protein